MTTAPDRPLDLRSFQDIVDQARRLIPKYCPEWTDHNLSDPGITLIELFAWMTEMTLFQLNRVPEEMYEQFLELVGVRRYPPAPATVEVTFNLSAALPRAIAVPAETEVATDRVGAADALVYATIAPLVIEPPVILALRAWRQGRGFEDYMPYVSSGLVEGRVFNDEPQEGDALYVGYAGELAGYSILLRIECEGDATAHIDPRDPPLLWEYWSGTREDWAPLRVLDASGSGQERDPADNDPTFGLTRPGDMPIHIPADSRPTAVDGVDATWIRVRYVRREGQGYDRSPVVTGIRAQALAATVSARHAQLVEGEELGDSDGTPGQRFPLREAPVLRQSDPHIIEAISGDETVEWTEVDDFADSGEDGRDFTIDYTRGEIRFGPFIRERDGSGRQHGAAPRRGAGLTLRAYRSGGGISGNVGEGAITQLRSSVPYVANVINYGAATGGLDAESLEEAKLRSLSVLKTTETAVTRDDYERLAMEVAGVDRAHCIVDETSGAVRLAIVPQLPPPPHELEPDDLTPSRGLIQAVSEYLDERKVLGTVISYDAAPYTSVDVDAHLLVAEDTDSEAVAAEAELALRRLLHPTTGGRSGRGTGLGASLSESQVAGVLQSLPGVAFVERVRLRVDGNDTPRAQAAADALLVLGGCFVLAEPVE